MHLPIHSITPFTLLDYPGKSACILWFAGCNMRCVYCYNPEIVLGRGRVGMEESLRFIRSRSGLLEGVVFSGGECTLHKSIFPLLESIKELGFLVKIDTNGSRPKVLEALLRQGLVDYIALDFKALEHRYHAITKSGLFSAFNDSLSLLIGADLPIEVRTTVHSDLIEQGDLQAMIRFLQDKGYTGTYYIQYYVNDVPVLGTLGRSMRDISISTLSTDHIQVLIRT